jgi:hypothetical protein
MKLMDANLGFSAIEATEKNAGKECAACKQEHNTKKFSV